MTRSRVELGRFGEELAKQYLMEQGLTVHAQNVRTQLGELDLVAWDGDCIVIVEVRTRRGSRFGTALESVDRRKRARLVSIARLYLAQNMMLKRLVRFDVVGVSWHPGHADPVIEHVVNAF